MKNDGFNWADHWVGMPEHISDNKRPARTIRVWLQQQDPQPTAGAVRKGMGFVTVHFEQQAGEKVNDFIAKIGKDPDAKDEVILDLDKAGLEKLYGHKIGHNSCWYPWREKDPHSRYVFTGGEQPQYPIYVISKGRWETPLTARALERMGVSYTIVVEPKEYDNYKKTFEGTYDDGKKYIHGRLRKAPEDFSEREQGSIPVRNYVWDLAIKEAGIKGRHWLMDDNIPTFNRTYKNLGIKANTGAIFRAVEAFADRYENVAFTGLQNSQFVISKWKWPAFFLNTRVYSCTLIKNDLDLSTPEYKSKNGAGDDVTVPTCSEKRWRGRYNEDTDLMIRALKKGWCTVLFVAFNADKVGTMVMKGGNTDELYAGDGRTKMAESLVAQHPDVARVGNRWQRKQHFVDYPACVEIGKEAKQGGCILKLKPKIELEEIRGNNEFGMILWDKVKNKEAEMDGERKARVVKEKNCEKCGGVYSADKGYKHRDGLCVKNLKDSATAISLTPTVLPVRANNELKDGFTRLVEAEVERRLALYRTEIEAEVRKELHSF